MGALLTGGVRNPNHQVSTATAAMTRMPPIQMIGFFPGANGENGFGSCSTGKGSTGTGLEMDVMGTGSVGRSWGAEPMELGAVELLMTWGAIAGAVAASDTFGAAADSTTSSRGT